MTEFSGPEGPIRDVTEGMRVVDADGETVGTVDEVRMADAGADTSAGQSSGGPRNVLEWVAEVFGGESGLSPQAQERLARLGFVRVDGRGLFSGRRYVEADQIASVAGDEVRLSVTEDQLFR
ncbi:DUF2171 domain-containing protein [Antribacter gilvus]|uniref:DUF2171 domain-containing protein n=1 Tax=Antribacter gilvus TaxID=2304675 RepID=UPI000F799BDE|nr:DUF2171 domain-containing protein [Antribacter gilvus]